MSWQGCRQRGWRHACQPFRSSSFSEPNTGSEPFHALGMEPFHSVLPGSRTEHILTIAAYGVAFSHAGLSRYLYLRPRRKVKATIPLFLHSSESPQATTTADRPTAGEAPLRRMGPTAVEALLRRMGQQPARRRLGGWGRRPSRCC
jgi:hypothetical protein